MTHKLYPAEYKTKSGDVLHLSSWYHNHKDKYEVDTELLAELEENSLNKFLFHENMAEVYNYLFDGMDGFDVVKSIHKKYDVTPLNHHDFMKMGLEVFRIVYSYYALKIRSHSNFVDIGFIQKNDLLPTGVCRAIRKEVESFPLRINKNEKNLLINHKNSILYKVFMEDDEIKQEVFHAIGLHVDSEWENNSFVQRIHKDSEGHLKEPDGFDTQCRTHSDIFSPSLKWWYFPDDVTTDHGPLWYCPESAYPTHEMLNYWWMETCKITSEKWNIPSWKEPSHSEGSLRISEEELNAFGFKMIPFKVPANTLIITNVHGWHRRGIQTDGFVRNAIHGSIRCEPFATEMFIDVHY